MSEMKVPHYTLDPCSLCGGYDQHRLTCIVVVAAHFNSHEIRDEGVRAAQSHDKHCIRCNIWGDRLTQQFCPHETDEHREAREARQRNERPGGQRPITEGEVLAVKKGSQMQAQQLGAADAKRVRDELRMFGRGNSIRAAMIQSIGAGWWRMSFINDPATVTYIADKQFHEQYDIISQGEPNEKRED